MKQLMNRREFIKFTGVAVGGLMAGFGILDIAYADTGIRGFFDTTTLANRIEMPILGFGTFPRTLGNDETQNTLTILNALKVGYKHVVVLNNAHSVGNAIAKSGILRKDLFVSVFLDLPNQEDYMQRNIITDDITSQFNLVLARLKLDYADMVVLNLPERGALNIESILDTWMSFENIYKGGRAKSIGISNLDMTYFNDFIYKCHIKPMANYLQMSPYNYDRRIVEVCKHHRIAVVINEVIYEYPEFLDEKAVLKISKNLNKSPEQILTRWNLQRGFVAIRGLGDSHDVEIEGKLFDFNLNQRDMKAITNLKRS